MKENTYDWSTLDATTIYIRTELIAYHLYLLELARKNKDQKEEKEQLAIIATYDRLEKKDMEVRECLKV